MTYWKKNALQCKWFSLRTTAWSGMKIRGVIGNIILTLPEAKYVFNLYRRIISSSSPHRWDTWRIGITILLRGVSRRSQVHKNSFLSGSFYLWNKAFVEQNWAHFSTWTCANTSSGILAGPPITQGKWQNVHISRWCTVNVKVKVKVPHAVIMSISIGAPWY